jgi:uncharacterized YigZ family protein
MNEKPIIRTIDEFCESEYKEKGSRFITQVFSAENEGNISAYLNETKKKYFDATHHCFAYKLLNDKTRYSDAGEPSGTAGIRILNAIEHFELVNVLIIVIRYFGGTKLGIGPLGKAYYTAAIQALQKAKIITKHNFYKVIIEIDFIFLSQILGILSHQDIKISNVKYGENVKFECFIKPENIENIMLQTKIASKGTAKIITLESIYS